MILEIATGAFDVSRLSSKTATRMPSAMLSPARRSRDVRVRSVGTPTKAGRSSIQRKIAQICSRAIVDGEVPTTSRVLDSLLASRRTVEWLIQDVRSVCSYLLVE